jgi:hypothetical protein
MENKKIPSTNLQIPNILQYPNDKKFGYSNLVIDYYLFIGAWDLEFIYGNILK